MRFFDRLCLCFRTGLGTAPRIVGSVCFLTLALAAPAGAIVIDFEALPAGHILTSADWPVGTTFTVDNATPGHPDEAIIFDSDCTIGTCSGDDDDLRTPGSGPGNDTAQGKIMIIAENVVDVAPADGLVDDPDDEAGGGTITLTFSQPYKLYAIRGVIDFEAGEDPSLVEIDTVGGPTLTFPFPLLGDNSASTIIILDPEPATEVRFIFDSSGGLDEIEIVLACGDGVVDDGEECDDAGANNDTVPDACRTDCTLPTCGDGVTDTGEQCDDGNTTPGDGCEPDCTFPPTTTTSVTTTTEQVTTTTEQVTTTTEQVTTTTEQVTTTTESVTTTSLSGTTTTTIPMCGDGIQNPGEECDDGIDNSDTDPNACRLDCTLPVCGDGIVDDQFGEGCDPPDDGPEICDNGIDDDADNDVDCEDTDCEGFTTVTPFCGVSCMEGVCKQVLRDPATITLPRNGKPGSFKIHAHVDVTDQNLDPTLVGFGISVRNSQGDVWSSTLPGTALKAKGSGQRRFAYRDRTARDGIGIHNGLYKVSTRFRQVNGTESYTFKIGAYSHDFEKATEAEMTIQIYGVAGVGMLTAEWTETKRGWKLRLSDFN